MHKAYSYVDKLLSDDECIQVLNSILEPGPITDIDLSVIDKVKKHIRGGHNCSVKLIYTTKYTTGQSSKPHIDAADITVIVLLGQEFKGGNLVIGSDTIALKIGDAIIFDSNTLHSVQPIDDGVRVALIIWLTRNN